MAAQSQNTSVRERPTPNIREEVPTAAGMSPGAPSTLSQLGSAAQEGAARFTSRLMDALGLVALILVALVVGVPLLIFLMIAALSGSDMAVTLLWVTVLGAGVAALVYRQRRHKAALLRRNAPGFGAQHAAPGQAQEDERIRRLAHLTLRASATLSAPLREKVVAASTATRDALRATAASGVATREAHDARQAADEDLPAAISTFQKLRQTGSSLAYGEVLLAEQLSLIEQRMRAVAEHEAGHHTRQLEAGRSYLQDKYAGGPSVK